MQKSLKLEEALMMILGIVLFSELSLSWWWFIGLFFAPDLGMIGYAVNPKAGAITYNIMHHKGIAVAIYLAGWYINNEIAMFVGALLFAHSAFDRMLGYGLKYPDAFTNTHLGRIGKKT